MITGSHITAITGNKEADVWASLFNQYLSKYDIYNTSRASAFLAQCAHESGGFKLLVENLNYSAQGLRKVFPKYFPDQATADKYARQPKWIASRVYGGRMGNGAESTQEGFKFRGRGLIQVTGKNNYTACSKFLFGDERLLDTPEYLETKEGAIQSACWFWTANNLNKFADAGDMIGLTVKINGGKNGIEDRMKYYQKALLAFGSSTFA